MGAEREALAQRNVLERDERYRAERAAEIAESHAFWRDYVARYSAPGAERPKGLPHPEDVIIEPGKAVWFRCGGDPEEAEKHWATLRRWRDAFLAQAEIGRRHHRLDKRRDDEIKITESELIVIVMDRILPKRHRLDEATDFRLRMKYMGMTKKALTVERRSILDFLPRRNEAKFTTKLIGMAEVEELRRKAEKNLRMSP